MKDEKYKAILYIITSVIVLTIGLQVYWNYKNYLQNKQNFINQVQVSFDNALDTYYADLAEKNAMTFIDVSADTLSFQGKLRKINPDSILETIKVECKEELDKEVSGFTQIQGSDSAFTFSKKSDHITQIKVLKGQNAADSMKLIKGIKSIFISIQNDTLDFTKLNPLIIHEFERKKFNIPYALIHYKNDHIFNTFNLKNQTPTFLKSNSKSTFLKQNEQLEILYPNARSIILYEGLTGIVLSSLLALAVISCLVYLLKIIKHQKQLAEVKNDFISNITHEFKTPIATIGVAIESIKDFHVIDNKEKTKTYLDISNQQLSKLNIMVEKLLETATLDSDNLLLDKEPYNIHDLILSIIEKHKIKTRAKSIIYEASNKHIISKIDLFHFENAINNVLDNAIKYGGDTIHVHLIQQNSGFNITISDNGKLAKVYKDKIFEKFYRIPKGNTHDVKGFGIGLYYTKKIIEKHDGSIQLSLKNNQTSFIMTFPNE